MTRHLTLMLSLTLPLLGACAETCDDMVLVSGVVVDKDGETLAGSTVRVMAAADYEEMLDGFDGDQDMESEDSDSDDSDSDDSDSDDGDEAEWIEVEADADGAFSFELVADQQWVLEARWADDRDNGEECEGRIVKFESSCGSDPLEVVLDDCYELD